MANYSRTEKYKKLRESLQSDNESENISTRDLSRFERRLNQIDSSNFKAPEDDYSLSDLHRATHARNIEKPQPKPQETYKPRQQEPKAPSYNAGSYRNENDSATFDNDFLDQYIREVKQYNIEQGNASSENTQVNILRSLNKNNQNDSVPDRPYSRRNAEDDTSNIQFEPVRKQRPVSTPSYQRDEDTRTAQLSSELFDDSPAQLEKRPEPEPEKPENGSSETMSREAIMQEVQNLVNGTGSSASSDNDSMHNTAQLNTSPFEEDDHSDHNTDSFSRHLQNERTARQQLLNETTQMRAQLDDYEDNLSEVSDKMQRTNRILNVVLIVLIIALAIILGIVIYWIVLSRG